MDKAEAWLESLAALHETLEANIEFTNVLPDSRFTLSIHTSAGEETMVGFANGRLFVDRSRSGITNFHPKFAARHEAPVRVVDGRLSLRLFLDRSSLEVFAADGEVSMTHQIFPTPGSRRISVSGERTTLGKIAIYPLKAGVK